MIGNGIKISWEYSDEYIEIDFSELNKFSPIFSSIEWWREERKWVRYHIASDIQKIRNSFFEIRIFYNQDKNLHILPDEVCWGESIIQIDTNAESGTATWIDANNKMNNGDVTWQRIDVPLIGERKKERVSRIQRNQDKFRSVLLALDECCAITGEETKEVLEAAHIIPAKSGGVEVIENGILLRADLHRMYDSNLFTICDNGKIEVHEDVTDSYKYLLKKNDQIKPEILKRVQRALKYVNKTTLE